MLLHWDLRIAATNAKLGFVFTRLGITPEHQAVAATKRLLWRQLVDPDPTRAKAREDAVFYWSGKTPDAAEGVNAFLDKRDPVWSMSNADLPPESIEPMPATDS